MSTRAQIRFATREVGVTFSEHPSAIHAQFYNHSDGYPEGLGVEIAESLLDSTKLSGWEVEHLDTRHGDLEYIYSKSPCFASKLSISHLCILPYALTDSAISTPNPSGYPSEWT